MLRGPPTETRMTETQGARPLRKASVRNGAIIWQKTSDGLSSARRCPSTAMAAPTVQVPYRRRHPPPNRPPPHRPPVRGVQLLRGAHLQSHQPRPRKATTMATLRITGTLRLAKGAIGGHCEGRKHEVHHRERHQTGLSLRPQPQPQPQPQRSP